MGLIDRIRDNPPRTLASLLALAVPPLTLWVTRWVQHLWADDPEMQVAMLGLALGVVVGAAERAGKWVQAHLTEPKAVVEGLQPFNPPPASDPDLPPIPEAKA